MLNDHQSLEILRLTISQAIQFLREDHFEVSSRMNWSSIAKDLLVELDANKSQLYILKDYLETLATLLLLRTTTKLEHIKLLELYEPGKKILNKLRDCGLSKFLEDGINEFLLTPQDWFMASKEQDRQLLRSQLLTLEENLLKAKKLFVNKEEKNPASTNSTFMDIIHANKDKKESFPFKSVFYESHTSLSLGLLKKECSFCLLDLDGNFGNI